MQRSRDLNEEQVLSCVNVRQDEKQRKTILKLKTLHGTVIVIPGFDLS